LAKYYLTIFGGIVLIVLGGLFLIYLGVSPTELATDAIFIGAGILLIRNAFLQKRKEKQEALKPQKSKGPIAKGRANGAASKRKKRADAQ
jgi:hypothetical protein